MSITITDKVRTVKTTTFQLDPEREVQKLDPYDPELLNTIENKPLITKSALGSELTNKLLPPELAAIIANDPGLQLLLAETGQTLDQYLGNVSSLLPPGFDVPTLLRNLDPSLLQGNLTALMGQFNLDDFIGKSPEFLTNVLGNMEQFSSVFNLERFNSQMILDVITNGISINELVSGSFALGNISEILNNPFVMSITGRLNALGIPGLTDILNIVETLGLANASKLSTISNQYTANATKQGIGRLTSYSYADNARMFSILGVIPDYKIISTTTSIKTIGITNTTSILNILDQSTTSTVNNTVNNFTLIGTHASSLLIDDIDNNSVALLTDLHTELAKLDSVEVDTFIADLITAGDVAAWRVINPAVVKFDALILVIDGSTITIIDGLISNKNYSNGVSLLSLINNIKSIGVIDSRSLLDISITVTVADMLLFIDIVRDVNTESIRSILGVATTDADLDMLSVLSEALDQLDLDSLILLNEMYKELGSVTLNTNSDLLLASTLNDIDIVLSVVSTSDLYSIIINSGLSGVVQQSTIMKTLKLSAVAGDIDALLELYKASGITLDRLYLDELVKDILTNYSLTPNVASLGPFTAATEMVDMLTLISPEWLFTDRDIDVVNNQGIFSTISPDMSFLLKHDSRTDTYIAVVNHI